MIDETYCKLCGAKCSGKMMIEVKKGKYIIVCSSCFNDPKLKTKDLNT